MNNLRLEIIQVNVLEIDGISTITENYTYPNSVWGGDYSLSVTIVFEEAEPVSFERNDLKFGDTWISIRMQIKKQSLMCAL